MHASWLPRSSANHNSLSQRLRIPLLGPQFARPRASAPQHLTCFSTSSRRQQPEPEPEPNPSSENPQGTRDKLLDTFQEVKYLNRNPKPVRKHYSHKAKDSTPRWGPNEGGPRKQKKPELPPIDYVGQYIHLLRDEYVEDRKLPWFHATSNSSLPLVRLNKEIFALVDFLLPNEKERVARNCVAEDVLELFSLNRNKALHGFGLEAFGSEVNSLATITSDLDFRLFDRNVYDESSVDDPRMAPRHAVRRRAIHALTQLRVALKHIHRPPIGGEVKLRNEGPYLFQTPVLLHARYPLIETTHRPTKIDVQIVSCNDPSHSLKVMGRYLEEIPHIRTIYVLLRRTLAVRGLTDVFNGGLGSYTLFYMIAAAMKHGPRPMPSTPGEVLLHVLRFYTSFDSDTKWMSLDPLQISEKRNLASEDAEGRPLPGVLWPERPYLLSIQDPADPTNDLPRQSFAWRHIRATFAVLRKELSLRLKTGDPRLLLVPFVGRFFGDVQVKRDALLKYQRAFSIGKLPPMGNVFFDKKKNPSFVALELAGSSEARETSGAGESDAGDTRAQNTAGHGKQATEPATESSIAWENHEKVSQEQKAAEPAQ